MIVLKGRLIDGNGNAPIENGLVAVEGNIITYAGRSNEFKVPPIAQIIEVPDGTIMPGLLRDIAIWALATTTLDGLMSMYSTK